MTDDLSHVHAPVTQVRLRNGIRCVVVDDPGSAAVIVSAASAAGFRHDPAGRAGTAHLTEHLLTVGGAPSTRGIETVGGSMTATTHPDHMEFTVSGPVEYWRECVDDQIGRLHGRFDVDEAEVDVQRRAVAEEIRALSASPSPWPAMTTALFEDDALGHEGFGIESDLASIDLRACEGFARSVLTPARGVVVIALDVAAVGGFETVLAVADRMIPAVEHGALRPRDTLPRRYAGRARTVTGPGVTRAWFGWSVPGVRRDRDAHAAFYALHRVLGDRCTDSRFGRSGFGCVGDRETLAVAPTEDIVEVLDVPVTPVEFDCARDDLVKVSLRVRRDPAALARAAILGGGIDLGDALRRVCLSLDRSELDILRRRLHDRRPAVVLPGDVEVDTTAELSRDQIPAPGPALRRMPVPAGPQPDSARRRVARETVVGHRSAGVVTAGPTHVRIRTADALDPVPRPWTAVPDLGGHRYAVTLSRVEAFRIAGSRVGSEIVEVAATGACAADVMTVLPTANAVAGLRVATDPVRAASQWLATGALNGVHRIEYGRPPTPRLLRTFGAGGSSAVPLGGADRRSLLRDVESWTDRQLSATRRFCSGQVAATTGSNEDAADLLLTLIASGVCLEPGRGDVLRSFAELLHSIDDRTVRDAARDLISTCV